MQKKSTIDFDQLKSMIEACSKGDDVTGDGTAADTGIDKSGDLGELVSAAINAATEKRKARKEAGEEVPEDITADEVMAELNAIMDAQAEDDAVKEGEEADDTKGAAAPSQTKSTKAAGKTAVNPAPVQRKYSSIFLMNPAAQQVKKEAKKIPADIQLARAVKCLDVFGRHDPERAAYYAKKMYSDEAMAREFKAMSVTSPSGGGYLVPEVYMDEIIELLYPKTVVFELGAQKVPMPNGNLNIPKMTSGTRATWGGEQRKIAKSQPTFGNVKLSAKRLEAIVPQTRELLMSTSYSADAMFATDLTRRMQLGMDFGAMFGAGGEFQPLGIANNKAIEKVDATTLNNTSLADSNGKITADFPAWLESKLLNKNVDDVRLGWTFNASVEGYLKNLKTQTGDYLYRDEMKSGMLLGYPYKRSNQITNDSNGKTSIIFGNWADLLAGEQAGLETYTTLDGSWVDENGVQHNAFDENLSATRALMYIDFAVRYTESFIVVNNVATA